MPPEAEDSASSASRPDPAQTVQVVPGPSRGSSRRNPDLLSWPPYRADIFAAVCLAISAYCVLSHRWPLFAVFALGCALIALLSPRMKGLFGLTASGDGVEIRGEFA